MHYSQFVTVASALALAPTAVVARQAAAAFVTVNSLDTCPKKVAQEIIKPGPKVVTTPYTCDKVKVSHGLDVSYYNFDIEPLTKDTVPYCKALKVFDNEGCLGFPTLWIPLESPLEVKCIPERYFSDEVKYISFQLDCSEDAPVKKEPIGPKEVAEQLAQQAQQAENSPKQEAQQGSKQGQEAQNGPKQEAHQDSRQAEAAPKQEQEPEQGSEEAEQAPEERKASNPADSLGLGELTKMLGFR
ncbi:protein ccpA [Aspergillus fischeri NRRL 181]|uniref:Uncharacterized protein n=1 Tax=Neosartorya fischeri (strain ATCC 1020 / DSM 3700 / CBS 544.65 / FGSC A1164 / JCM 1740 / NRRL 181 / WB 181) TaxID=331117 RepID=A1D251_NEOFI|nr:conserved hypothetical protein [Aspergillus fischeri NRRL 181]EAW22494.1 conserved hypothetical protein [Aspergillus fischeri NRRL 181]